MCVYFMVVYSFIYEILFQGLTPNLYNSSGSLMLLFGLYIILIGSADEAAKH